MNSKLLALLLALCPLLLIAQSRQMLPLDLQKDLKSFDPDQKINLYLRGDLSTLSQFVRANDGTAKGRLSSILSCAIPARAIPELNSLEGLDYVEYSGGTPHVLSDTMLVNNNVMPVHLGAAPLPQAFLGEDVIIGFIDTGIELAHPDFQHADGTTRVVALWDQNQEETIPFRVPEPYGYGQEWNAEDIDAGISNHDDLAGYYGHGSTVAGVAAGNGYATGNFTGVAPAADIIAVASDLDNPNWAATTADAIDFIFAKADALGKPAVVNLSLGDYYGSHDGLDAPTLFSDALLEAAPGRAIVAAAGNSGNLGAYHLGYQIPESDTAFTWFEYSSAAEAVYFEIWADTADFNNAAYAVGADITVPEYDFRGYSSWRRASENLNIVLTDTIFHEGALIGIVNTWCGLRGGQYQLQVQVTQPFSNQYLWRFSTTGGGTFDCWSYDPFGTSAIVNTGLPDVGDFPDMVHYQLPDNSKTIVDSWVCSDKVITVGNYVNRKSFTNYLQEETTYPDTPGAISINSSRGPTRDNRQKPDIAASGDHTLSAGRLATLNQWININPGKVAEDGMHYINGGTSLASPVVAGVAALYFDRDTTATWLEVKNAIIDNALADQYTGVLPGYRFGYGKVNAFATLTVPFTVSAIAGIASRKKILIYPNPASGEITLEGLDSPIRSISVFDITGREVQPTLHYFTGNQTIEVDVSDFKSGVYFVYSGMVSGEMAVAKLIVEK